MAPAYRPQLLADLQERTGLPVKRVEVGKIDFLRDTAELKIYYDEPQPTTQLNAVTAMPGILEVERQK
ncbi:MAG TPA: DUF4956 domain-containing protein [Anaerolineae bacterium]|nr:DUF4956 domain-containing protein [Anaerolineae bacterium]